MKKKAKKSESANDKEQRKKKIKTQTQPDWQNKWSQSAFQSFLYAERITPLRYPNKITHTQNLKHVNYYHNCIKLCSMIKCPLVGLFW